MVKLSLLKSCDYILSNKDIKELEEKAYSINKIPQLILMEEATSKIYEKLIVDFDIKNHNIGIIAGYGNNGGDALSLARKIFFEIGIKLDIFIFENKNESELFKIQKTILQTFNFNFISIEKLKNLIKNYTLIIDGIFGIGYKYRNDPFIDEIFTIINNSNSNIVSIDVPSGLNKENKSMIKSNKTYSIGFLKEELFNIQTRKNCGYIENIKISFDIQNIKLEKNNYYFDIKNFTLTESKKENFVNKYSKGASLFIGGTKGKAGSIIFSALAALRSGAGISTVITEDENITFINSISSEIVVDSFTNFENYIDKYSVITVGPGLKLSEKNKNILKESFKLKKQFILDASFFTIFENSILKDFTIPPILTPHLGEFKIFFKEYQDSIYKDTFNTIKDICKKFNLYLLLKDVDIIIGNPYSEIFVIDNPERLMAQAGSGDILSGIISGIISQKGDIFESIFKALKIFYTIGNFYAKKGYISYKIFDFIDKISYWEKL